MGCGASIPTKPIDKCVEKTLEKEETLNKEKTLEEELSQVFGDKKSLDAVMNSVKEIEEAIKMDSFVDNVFERLVFVLNLAAKITPSVQIYQFTLTFSFLSDSLQKIINVLNSITTKEEKNAYSKLERLRDLDLAAEAFGYEKSLLNIKAYMHGFESHEKTPDSRQVINTLEDKIHVNDIARFLGKMQAKTGELMVASDVTSACRASAYVNLYFRLAILRRMVLWQVLCIKNRSGSDQASSQGVLAMINESQKTDLDMARLVTEANVKKAVFLFVFHPSENIFFLYFLRIHDQECKLPNISQEIDFKTRNYVLRLFSNRNQKVQIHSNYDYVTVTSNNSEGCKFTFEPVENRQLDNIFYLKSTQWLQYYVYAKNDRYCYSVQDKPGIYGHWKLTRLAYDERRPYFIISPVVWPGCFLSFQKANTALKFLAVFPIVDNNTTDYLMCSEDIGELQGKGLWEIIEV